MQGTCGVIIINLFWICVYAVYTVKSTNMTLEYWVNIYNAYDSSHHIMRLSSPNDKSNSAYP